MLVYSFYNLMVIEIESLLARGRISAARRLYGELKGQLREGILSLFEMDTKVLPLPLRSTIWYCARELLNDKDQLFASTQAAKKRAPPRIESIVRALGIGVAAEMRFFHRAVADLEIILSSIDLGPLPERPDDRKKGRR